MASTVRRRVLGIVTLTVLCFGALIYFVISPPRPQLQILAEDIPTAGALKKLHLPAELAILPPTFVLEKYQTMTRKAYQDLANNTGVYDLILDYNTALAPFVRGHFVYNLDELKSMVASELRDGKFPFEDDLFQSAWREVGWYGEGADAATGQPVAIPFAANTMVLCYNRRFFENPQYKLEYRKKFKADLEPPQDWPTFYRLAEFFTRRDEGTYGLAMQGDPYFMYYEWANFAFSMGGGVMQKQHGWQGNELTPLILDSQQTVRATEFYLSLKPFNASTNFFATDAIRQRDEFMRKGNVAMAIMWTDVLHDLARSDGGQIFGYAAIPGSVSMLAGGSYYFNRHGRNPKQAMRLVLHYMRKDVQEELLRNGLCSPLRSAYTPDAIKRVAYADALRKSLDRGVYMLEAGPDAEVIINSIGKTLQELWTGNTGQSVSVALRTTQQDIANKRKDIFSKLRQ